MNKHSIFIVLQLFTLFSAPLSAMEQDHKRQKTEFTNEESTELTNEESAVLSYIRQRSLILFNGCAELNPSILNKEVILNEIVCNSNASFINCIRNKLIAFPDAYYQEKKARVLSLVESSMSVIMRNLDKIDISKFNINCFDDGMARAVITSMQNTNNLKSFIKKIGISSEQIRSLTEILAHVKYAYVVEKLLPFTKCDDSTLFASGKDKVSVFVPLAQIQYDFPTYLAVEEDKGGERAIKNKTLKVLQEQFVELLTK